MELPLSPEQERELSQLANRKGRKPGDLAREVIGFYLEHEARFVEAVKRGIASADAGNLIEHEEVLARVERLFQSQIRIRWTPEAATDLEQIARHILRDNPSAARSVVRRLTEGTERLTKFPNLGRPGQVSNTRELVFASLPYIAIYRLKDEVVEILRIYPGAQDWP